MTYIVLVEKLNPALSIYLHSALAVTAPVDTRVVTRRVVISFRDHWVRDPTICSSLHGFNLRRHSRPLMNRLRTGQEVHAVLTCTNVFLMSNAHRRRRRDATVELSRVGVGCVLGLMSASWASNSTMNQMVDARPITQEAQLLLGDRATRKHAKDS